MESSREGESAERGRSSLARAGKGAAGGSSGRVTVYEVRMLRERGGLGPTPNVGKGGAGGAARAGRRDAEAGEVTTGRRAPSPAVTAAEGPRALRQPPRRPARALRPTGGPAAPRRQRRGGAAPPPSRPPTRLPRGRPGLPGDPLRAGPSVLGRR